MDMHPSITSDRIQELIAEDDCQGVCIACGETAHGVEPDARDYTCEYCGEAKVYGAEELLFELEV